MAGHSVPPVADDPEDTLVERVSMDGLPPVVTQEDVDDTRAQVDDDGVFVSGQSNADALSALCHHLQVDVIEWYHKQCDAHQTTGLYSWLRCHRLQAVGIILLGFSTLMLAIGASTTQAYTVSVIVQAVLLACITLLNIALNSVSNRRYQYEVLHRVALILNWARDMTALSDADNPGISMACSWLKLSIVVRGDRKRILPSAVLVPGDIVVLLPGQPTPCACTTLDSSLKVSLKLGEAVPGNTFGGVDETDSAEPVLLRVDECAVVNCLRDALSQDLAPLSTLEDQHLLCAKFIYCWFVPLVFIISMAMQALVLLVVLDGSRDWGLAVFVLPVHNILPLLPLVLPILWEGVVLFCTAKLLLPLYLLREKQDPNSASWKTLLRFWIQLCFGTGGPEFLPRASRVLFQLGCVTTLCCVDKTGVLSLPTATPSKVFFFEPDDELGEEPSDIPSPPTATAHLEPDQNSPSGSCLGETFMQPSGGDKLVVLVRLENEHSRSASLLPGREDVAKEVDSGEHKLCNVISHSLPNDLSHTAASDDASRLPVVPTVDPSHSKSHVLDITYRFEGGTLEFDDLDWKRHLPSLLPLGLNSVLNHNFPIAEQLHDTASLVTLLSDLVSPDIVGKECLCSLGFQIGLQAYTCDHHYKKHQRVVLSALRAPTVMPIHIAAQRTNSMYSTSQQSNWPLRLVSKMVSAEGHLQLMTQGSGDLVLEASTEYFNGDDICPMAANERKSIQEFYNRHALEGHCIACAYRPLPKQAQDHVRREEKTVLLCLGPSQQLGVDLGDTISAYSALDLNAIGDGRGNLSGPSRRASSVSLDCRHRSSTGTYLEFPSTPSYFQRMVNEQIFIGMIALQYLPREDIVCLVEGARTAGIRFVYFSSESEQRSRVFSSRLGFETGWNCHISLKPRDSSSSQPQSAASPRSMPGPVIFEESSDVQCSPSTGTGLAALSGGTSVTVDSRGERASYQHHSRNVSAQPSMESVEVDYNETARLPRGINEIRPHLETVDNVPLKVPLFTDCQPDAVREMMEIMQENGEVVCCMGSSLDLQNTSAFLQANIGVAIEPELPDQPCSNVELSKGDGEWLQLATRLCSVPCPIVFHRNDPISLLSLIGQARDSLHHISQYFMFLTGCYMSLSALLMLASVFFLPPPLSGLHVLWFTLIILPALSLGILCGPPNPGALLHIPSRTNDHDLPTKKLLAHYFVRVFPIAVVALVCHGVVLGSFCKSMAGENISHDPLNSSATCHPLLGNRNSNGTTGLWNFPLEQVALAQEVTAFIFIFFCSVLSLTFYQRTLPLLSYIRNIPWQSYTLLIGSIVAQLLFSVVSMAVWFPSSAEAFRLLRSVQPVVWVLLLATPFVLLVTSEIIKFREHRLQCRLQRYSKLIFETKLGMNSPI